MTLPKDITVTSKNQVTLPADYVREIGLAQHRILRAELKGKSIILTAEPDLIQQIQPFWRRHKVKRPLSDAELKEAIRDSAARQATQEKID